MTRIIGGSAGGRRITAPAGQHTRPTTDRVREALFSSIESWCGSLQGLRFLDLYAGSGAVGLEAWSRGAGVVTLVESDRRTARLIGDNARTLGFAKADVVAPAPVAATLAEPPAAPYDVVFLDPPYPLDDVGARRGPRAARRAALAGARARWSWSSGPRAARSRRGRPASSGAAQQAVRRDDALVRSRRREAHGA